MSPELNDTFRKEFFETVKTLLLESGEVVVPGLGTFRIQHRPAFILSEAVDLGEAERVSGEKGSHSSFESSMRPPSDTIVFESQLGASG